MSENEDSASISEEDYDLCLGCGPSSSIVGFPSRYPIARINDIVSRMKQHLRKYKIDDVVEEVSICARCGEIIIKPKEEKTEDDYYEDEFVTLSNAQWTTGTDEEDVEEIMDILSDFEYFRSSKSDEESIKEFFRGK